MAPLAVLNRSENATKIWGVFASKKIKFNPSNPVIGEYTGELVRINATNIDDHSYVFNLSHIETIGIDAKRKRNWTAMVNGSASSATANVEACVDGEKIDYVLKRTINPGEQLLIFYGNDYQHDRDNFRFLNTTNNWLESSDILRLHEKKYIKNELQPAFAALFTSLVDLTVMIPAWNEKKIDSMFNSLPILSCLRDTVLPQSQQENITLLMLYCWHGSVEKITKLLKQGVNPNTQSSISGVSVFHIIAKAPYSLRKKKKIIALLLDSNADICLQNKNGETLLNFAIHADDIGLVTFLMQNHRELTNVIDQDDLDCFVYAIRHGSFNIITLLQHAITQNDLMLYEKNHQLERAFDHLFKRPIAPQDQLNIARIIVNLVAENWTLTTQLIEVINQLKADKLRSEAADALLLLPHSEKYIPRESTHTHGLKRDKPASDVMHNSTSFFNEPKRAKYQTGEEGYSDRCRWVDL